MKASPGARSWMAAGVRHELLTRALPALRHDMAAPVSVVRMSMLLLKRQLGAAAEPDAAPLDAGSALERLGLIEEQVASLAAGVRSLRDWELATHDGGITRSALVLQSTGLMRVPFELNGIGLQIDEALAPDAGEPSYPSGAALRYLFLGALGYLHDSVPDLGRIRVEAEGHDALCLVGGRGDAEPVEPIAGAHRAPRALAIDEIALQALADSLGFKVEVKGESVRFGLGAALVASAT